METGDSFADEKPISASPVTRSSDRHNRMPERSCLLCHQRKIRCDKKAPCSHCVRADVLCCYPAPERTSRRPQKTTIAEVAARLARLERTITAISNGAPSSQPDSNINSISALSPSHGSEVGMSESQTTGGSPEELIVQDGDSSRYINESLLLRVLEEEQEFQSSMGSVDGDSNCGRKPSSFDIGGLFSSFNRSMPDAQSHHPSRWHAVQLWQAFVANVDPLVKILHIPTTQATVFAAINNANHIDEDVGALLCSIYFAATTSLTAIDAANLLGQSKSTALNKFKQGLEHSLAGANILDTPSIRSLQAMTIYLTCLRAYNGGRAIWTLNGLAIRSAQSIGLHRDGKNFHLPAFESEMRRRLWWYMCSQDSRAGEDHGITLDPSDGYSDTGFPSNVDDNEISSDMQELPAEKARWTEMTFVLNMLKIGYAFQPLHRRPRASFNTPEMGESSRRQILNSLKTHLEDTYLKHCDPNIPIQQFTLLTARVRLAKLDFLVSHQWLNRRDSEKEHPPFRRTTEDALVAACQILEMDVQIQSEDLFRGFSWFAETYVQYWVLTYVLWHFCVKPVGPSVERAWKAVAASFEVTERHKKNVAYESGSKWTVLQRLRDKAMRIRDNLRCKTDSGSSGGGPQDASFGMDPMLTGEFGGLTSGLTFGDGSHWEMSAANLPDWSNFGGNFEMQADELQETRW